MRPKGISNLIFAVIMIIIVIFLATGFLYWTLGVGETFENSTEGSTKSSLKKTQTSFFITNIDGDEITLKNNGQVSIDVDDFSFYLNGSQATSNAVGPLPIPSSIDPSEVVTFELSGFSDDNYLVRVTGPFGLADEVFEELTSGGPGPGPFFSDVDRPSSAGTLTTTGTVRNDFYTALEVSTQNCGQGTCDTGDSWGAGFDDANPANTQVDWDFDLSALGISGSDIENITIYGGGCWQGGASRNCNGADDAEFTVLTEPQLHVYIYDWTGGWDQITCESGTHNCIGPGYNITDGGNNFAGPGADYQTYQFEKTSGFTDDHMSAGGIVRIRYELTGNTMGPSYDVRGVYDFALLTTFYS
ncbi:MAG: hypothetical protein JSV92_04415 [archaeon]|nr:MAG: hypothetical protein JSV92_04415 [archaeon]